MFKTILAFIKAHTIATAITATVVVSTVVATPIIINQAQKPKQEIETGEVQENIIDNTVIDNTVEEETETPEENITDENTTVPEEEENKNQGTTKPTTPTSSTPTSNNNTNQGTTGAWGGDIDTESSIKFDESKLVKFNCFIPEDGVTLGYDPENKVVYNLPWQSPIPKEHWLNSTYYTYKKNLTESIEVARRDVDPANGDYTKEYCQNKLSEITTELNQAKSALEYLKSHKDEIQVTSQNTFKYGSEYYASDERDLEAYIGRCENSRNEWQQKLNNAPQYRTF